MLEYIDGKPIHDYVSSARKMTFGEKLDLIEALCRGVHRLHECNLVFGDLSANNVLVEPGDRIRFIDLAGSKRLAKAYSGSQSSINMGTPGMVPDSVLTGEARTARWTDIYATSAISFLILTGKTPSESPPSRWDAELASYRVPRAVRKLILKGLREPAAHKTHDPSVYPTARKMADDLAAWKTRRQQRRTALVFGLPVLVCLIALACVAWVGWSRLEAERTEFEWRRFTGLRQRVLNLPNVSQPAIQTALGDVDELAQQRMQQLEDRQDSQAGSTLTQMTQTLERALDTNAALGPCLELREALATELLAGTPDAIIPWATDCQHIQDGLAALSERNAEIKSQLDQGDTKAAYNALVVLHKDILELKSDNDEALRIREPRQRYQTNKASLPERLQKLAATDTEFDTIDSLARSGGLDWNNGAWDGADRNFGQAIQRLNAWLEKHETPAERQSRETQLQADREAALKADLARVTSERDTALKQRDGLQTSLGALSDKLAAKDDDIKREQQRAETLQAESTRLAAEISNLKSERDTLTAGAAAKDAALQKQVKETDRWKTRAQNAENLFASLPKSGVNTDDSTGVIINADKIATAIEARLETLDSSDRDAAAKLLREAVQEWQAEDRQLATLAAARVELLKTVAEGGEDVTKLDAKIAAVRAAAERKERAVRAALAKMDQADQVQFNEIAAAIQQLEKVVAEWMDPNGKRKLLAKHPDVVKLNGQVAAHKQRQAPFAAGAARAAGTAKALDIAEIVELSGSPAIAVSGKGFTDPDGMEFVVVPAGEFPMGSPDGDGKSSSDEKPQHTVRITKNFGMGKFEVTRGQFAMFVKDTNYVTDAEKGDGGYGWSSTSGKFSQSKDYTWRSAGFPQTDEHPVVNVSWNDVAAYVAWRSKKYGRTYRLPTEAEFEYANRAGTTTRYASGSDDIETVAKIGNIADGIASEKVSSWKTIQAKDGYVFTAPVGQFAANKFGLHDLTGNVWEWCADWYDSGYYKQFAGKTVDDPQGPTAGSSRVLRGGGFFSTNRTRVAYRNYNTPTSAGNNMGFRVVLVLE